MSKRIPAEVFPPGEFIRDELEARGWTQTDLAEILGRPLKAVSEILTGKRAITPETATGLGEAFGVDPQFWMNLESAYRLSKVESKAGEVSRRARLYALAPVQDMIRRNWISDAEDIDGLEREVLGFFGAGSVEEIPALSLKAAARKSTSYEKTTPPQLAWLCRARQIASTLQVSAYRKDGFDQLLGELLRFTSSEREARRIPRLLAEFGIRFMIVEHLPRTRIDGAALWLDEHSPVVALSIRLDRIDCFWFTLLHELGHIFHGHSLGIDDGIVGDGPPPVGEMPEDELVANDFARDHLIPNKEIDSFIARVRPLYSRVRINQFANRIKVHPGIIVGQLQYRGEIKYSQARDMLVKIRDSVTQSAVTDGWGYYPPGS
jgi:HTH-type transcriptional regulator / antitoxin HigA